MGQVVKWGNSAESIHLTCDVLMDRLINNSLAENTHGVLLQNDSESLNQNI